jgi:hypothetical protein
MVDFIKLYWRDKSIFGPFVTDRTNFARLYSVLEEHSGEITYPKKARFENMLVVVSEKSGYVKNSIHKLHNLLKGEADHNHNDFSYSNLSFTIDNLASKLSDVDSAIITQLEFGFNITTTIPAEIIIERMVLMHKHKGANHDKEYHGNGKLKQFDRSTYLIKVYDKAKQYELGQNILRFELKLFTRRELMRLGVNHLNDLKDKVILENLFKFTLKRFDEMTIIDKIQDPIKITCKDDKVLSIYRNPSFWQNELANLHTETRARHKRKFHDLLIKYDLLKTKKTLKKALIDKFRYLMDN